MSLLNKSLRKIDVNPNAPKIEIHSRTIRAFTDQYYSGIVKTQVERKNGTTFFEFYPDYVEQTDINPRPEVESFVINDAFIKRMLEDQEFPKFIWAIFNSINTQKKL